MIAPSRFFFAAAVLLACGCADVAGDDEPMASSSAAVSNDSARHRRAKQMFENPVIARMWMPGLHKTVGNKDAAEVARVLKIKKPSIVSGLIRFDEDPNLDAQEQVFTDFRAVRQAMKGVAFDVVLNACQYKGPDALTDHMKQINEKLGGLKPESWFFDFYDTPVHDRDGECDARGPGAKAMLRKVADWAHRNNQLIGGNVWSSSGLPEGADYYAVPDEHGKQSTLDLAKRLPDSAVKLVHVENNPQNCWVKGGDVSTLDDPRHPTKEKCKGSGGDEYIWRMTPNEREKYDSNFTEEGRNQGFEYMKPIFFPLSDHIKGDGVQAFDRHANLPANQLSYVAGP